MPIGILLTCLWGWTLTDSKSVLFLSAGGGFVRQALNRETAVPIANVPDAIDAAHLSPNGKWILYATHRGDTTPSAERLVRIPIEGRQPELVFTPKLSRQLANASGFGWPFACAEAPATLCLIAEQSEDGIELAFSASDP